MCPPNHTRTFEFPSISLLAQACAAFVACTVVLATVDSVLEVADHFLKTDRAAAKLRKEAAAASTSASASTSSSSVSSSSASVSAHAGGGAKHGPAAAALQMAQFVGAMALGFVWFWNDPGAVPINEIASIRFNSMFVFCFQRVIFHSVSINSFSPPFSDSMQSS
jgi:hypothetical protein